MREEDSYAWQSFSSRHRTRYATTQAYRKGGIPKYTYGMGIDILELYKECPDAVIKVKVSDIVEANRSLLAEAITQFEKAHETFDATQMMSAEEVMKYLQVSRNTLDRWAKVGEFGEPPYLPKIKVGVSVRYNKEDVERVKVREEERHAR